MIESPLNDAQNPVLGISPTILLASATWFYVVFTKIKGYNNARYSNVLK